MALPSRTWRGGWINIGWYGNPVPGYALCREGKTGERTTVEDARTVPQDLGNDDWNKERRRVVPRHAFEIT